MMSYPNTQKTFFTLTFILAAFPILTFGIRSVISALWFILGIILYFGCPKTKPDLNKDIWFFLVPFITLIISLFYSNNLSFGVDILIKMLSFILFPLVFYLNIDKFKSNDKLKILYIFSFSVFILILYQMIKILFNLEFILQDLSLDEIKINGFGSINEVSNDVISRIKLRRFRNYSIGISNTHTTYQGLWICFSAFFIGIEFRKSSNKSHRILFAIILAIFIIWLYLISARMPIVALLISVTLSFFVFSKVQLKRKILISSFPFLAMIFLLFFDNPFSSRIKEYYETGFTILKNNSSTNEFNSSNVRNGIYYCDFKLIEKSTMLGVGVGDVQDELNGCYRDFIKSKIYLWQNYNSHNQYAYFWLASGFLGFCSFLFLLTMNVLKSVKQKNIILFYLVCSTSIIFLTENLLARSDGVIFFSFFIGLFYFNQKNRLSI